MVSPVIAFDADDTLWENEQFFRLTEESFTSLLADYADPKDLSNRLLEAERRNLQHYGFGAKGFTLSMIETAIEITEGSVPSSVISEILSAGQSLLNYPVKPFDGAFDVLEDLSKSFTLIIITKGDLFDQERKVAQSGLGQFFKGVEVVSHKNKATYEAVWEKHVDDVSTTAMVGNSLASDIIPALEAGSWALHIPHHLTWELEKAKAPTSHARFREIGELHQLPELISNLFQSS